LVRILADIALGLAALEGARGRLDPFGSVYGQLVAENAMWFGVLHSPRPQLGFRGARLSSSALFTDCTGRADELGTATLSNRSTQYFTSATKKVSHGDFYAHNYIDNERRHVCLVILEPRPKYGNLSMDQQQRALNK